MNGFHRPDPSEYARFYAGYVATAPDGDVLATLHTQREAMQDLLRSVPADREAFRYAQDKWSIREVAGHVIDMERVFAYRMLSFARETDPTLPGVDENEYAAAAPFHGQALAAIGREYLAVRNATISLVEGFGAEMADRTGIASGNPFTLRALVWIAAGHERHHMTVIRERYLED